MKLNFFLFILSQSSIFFNCLGMEHKDLNPLKTAVNKAFENFGLSGNLYSVYEDNHEPTPRENIWRWYRDSQTIGFTPDICNNRDLVEFASYCVAADVKNSGYLKAQCARWASGALCFAAPIITSFKTSHSSLHCLAFLASCVPGLVLAVDPYKLQTKLFDALDNSIATTSFALACQKLVENKNYKPLAAYYAYARTIKHMPVGQEKQLEIIRNILFEDSKTLIRNEYREKFELKILDMRKTTSAGEPTVCAVATYP